MRPLAIRALSAISAIGRGAEPMFDALSNRRGGLSPCDFAGVTSGWIGRVPGVESHAVPPRLAHFDCRNNRLADMALHTDGFAARVAEARARLGADRIGVVVGTSTSGVGALEDAYVARDPVSGALPPDFDFVHTHDLSSLASYVREALDLAGPALTVSAACASSARCFVDAAHFIETGVCDAVVVGGADSLCGMTLRGFASLGLVSPRACRPCDTARDGVSIGEAAGFALLEPLWTNSGRTAVPGLAVLGTGSSSDAHHMSAPHPEALGAVLAMRAALADAGLAPEAIDYVNLHGTGTRANDAMEDRAVMTVFGSGVPGSATKGWTGHTMGSSGILELAISALCIEHDMVPGCLAVDEVDPSFEALVVTVNEHRTVRRVISNSFGFGGINCSLILGRTS
ncbi:MAG: beta-ketoacyl-[acyl-carrier-protein] synthase family protein [Acetobacteraceae bacterium]|nr:beta-ketoacyl-[acyl-carrier-protein] synthase family protein [Acetobacteraceae bacterium]